MHQTKAQRNHKYQSLHIERNRRINAKGREIRGKEKGRNPTDTKREVSGIGGGGGVG